MCYAVRIDWIATGARDARPHGCAWNDRVVGMAFLIGTDEAGYGPNLGPLVVSATLWNVGAGTTGENLYRVLSRAVTPVPESEDGNRIWLGDSKQLYRAGHSLAPLERALLVALVAADRPLPRSWRKLWSILDPQADASVDLLPWYCDFDESLPVEESVATLFEAGRHLRDRMRGQGVQLVDIQSRVVFADEFNRRLAEHGNKSTSLSELTLDLVLNLLEGLDGSVFVTCDKHGGRNRYARLLQERFPDSLVEIRQEGRCESRYEFGSSDRRRQFRFRAKGDTELPAALASVASKYLREMAMRAFNAFWQDRVGELRPTAGYPVDARRFKDDISSTQASLGISDQILWRVR